MSNLSPVPQPGLPAIHVDQIDTATLPPAEGPKCVFFDPAEAKQAQKTGLNARTLERFVRYLHRRQCIQQRLPVPEDHIQGCTSSGNVYRHLDAGTRELGRALRAALLPLLTDGDSGGKAAIAEKAAVEVLSRALRAAVLEMAVGKEATFRKWRAWSGIKGAMVLPNTDRELDSFRDYLAFCAPQGGSGSGKGAAAAAAESGDSDSEAFFTSAYQVRGFERTRDLVLSLKERSREIAVALQQAPDWETAANAVTRKAIAEVGPYFGGQALCGCVCAADFLRSPAACLLGGSPHTASSDTAIQHVLSPFSIISAVHPLTCLCISSSSHPRPAPPFASRISQNPALCRLGLPISSQGLSRLH